MNIEQLLKEPESRKIFGKKEIEIILKQIHGVRLTQSEKNRLSMDIRKKFLFIEKARNIKINLEHGIKIKNIIKRAVKEILKIIKPEAILLFGSHATKSAWKRSDIDICIVMGREVSKEEAIKLRMAVSGRVSDSVDIQVFENLPTRIQKAIADDHKELYRRKTFDDVEFTVNTWIKYADYRKEVLPWIS